MESRNPVRKAILIIKKTERYFFPKSKYRERRVKRIQNNFERFTCKRGDLQKLDQTPSVKLAETRQAWI